MTDSSTPSKPPKTFADILGLNAKGIIAVVVVLLGGGTGLAAFDFCTNDEVKNYLDDAREFEDIRHVKIDETFMEQSEKMDELGEGIDSVRSTQIREIARREARRITEEIRNEERRQDEFVRIFSRNIRRLERGQDPCGSLTCDEQ